MPVRGHKGAARPTTLSGAINNTDLTFTVTTGGGAGYPDGTTGVFVVTLDAGLAGEEKVLCSARTGDTFTVTTRGYDDTTASAHQNQASVQHTFSAVEAHEANAHINATTAAHAATAISYAGSTNLSSTNVEAALDELDAEKSQVGHGHAKTFRISHTWTISTPAVPSGATAYIPPFFVSLPVGQTATIYGARHRIRGGTSATWTISHGTPDAGSTVTGLSGIASTTTPATTTASGGNTLANGDAVQLVLSAVSGSPDGLTVTVFLDVTV